MHKIRLIVIMLAIILLTGNVVQASSWDIVNIANGQSYSSTDYYVMAQKLVETYPDLLHMDIIGKSIDSKPIYAIVMTSNVQETMARDDLYVYREHYYVEAGNHSREIVNTAIVMKQIEDYAKDYYNDTFIREFSIKAELDKAIIHFIPLVSPDGHDLVKFGRSSVNTTEGLNALATVTDTNYARFKSNLAGVDLNRNFPDEYYDLQTKQWVNKFQQHPNDMHSYAPSGEFYSGPYGGSEPETQAIMDYVVKYDFRNFLSYHSQGKILYHNKNWFSADYNKEALDLARVVSKVNGYRVTASGDGTGSGFFTDFVAAQTLKPVLTVETTNVPAPTPQSHFASAYNENSLLPLYTIQEGRSKGYYKYRLYVDNKYVRDFSEKSYAEAHLSKVANGKIVKGTEVPPLYLITTITREIFLEKLIGNYYGLTSLTVNATDTFNDTKSIVPTFAKNRGILSAGNGNFRPNDSVTSEEVAAIIQRVHIELGTEFDAEYKNYVLEGNYSEWATDSIKYVLHHNYMTEKEFKTRLFDSNQINELGAFKN